MVTAAAPTDAFHWLVGGGEMGSHIRTHDWKNTPLGAVESWSPALRMMVPFMLANRFPMLLWWGPQYISLYNDPYRPILGTKHPWALAKPVSECWSEIWHILKPLIDAPFHGGPATWDEDILLEINRHGFVEETHFGIAYSPVPDETVPSGIGGVLATVHETTEKVLAQRRAVALRDLGARAGEAKTVEDTCRILTDTLVANDKDVPFALLYLIDTDGKQARLASAAGCGAQCRGCPPLVDLAPLIDLAAAQQPWPFATVLRTQKLQIVDDLPSRFGAAVPAGPWSDAPRQAVMVPIRSAIGHQLAGILVAGVSARLQLDELYRGFYELVASQAATAIASAEAYEVERKRADALAEIDRVKTRFFSNVSHELRTPLALILGPLQDALADTDAQLPRDRLQMLHRNAQRLQKLVDTLLDFSRIEAGRMQASFEAIDLAKFTAELASAFRSAVETVGMRLVVDCPVLREPVYVDRDMYEKIVLNLISNAFKFTLEGEIEVRLREFDDKVELSVRDTGSGIAEAQLPHIFERFHRIEGVLARTQEGTGIGLALVQELVKLHGGLVAVESIERAGSTFTVTFLKGRNHLPAERIATARTASSATLGDQYFLEEALRWLPANAMAGGARSATGETARASTPDIPTATRARLVWADDNADMRDYVERLLSSRYDIEVVPDGAAALAAIHRQLPDLVLSDVMMPNLDGFGLLRALRDDERTSTIPVILLSARAGEEARVEGMQAGADDYLVKPFSARELLARISAHVEMAQLRREHEAQTAADLEAITQLYDVNNRCARAGSDLEACLADIVDTAIRLTGADKGNLQLVDPQSGTLKIAAQRGFEKPFLDFFDTVRTDDVFACAAARQSRQRVVVEDLHLSPLFAGQPALQVLLDAGMQAVQSTPLISGAGNLLGMVSTHFSQPRRLDERESRLMDLLARQAADYLERRQSEQALQVSETRYRTLFDSIDEGYCIIRVIFDDTGKPVDYIFEEVNKSFARHTGISDAVDRSMRDIEPAHDAHWFDAYGRIALTGQPERFVSVATALDRWYDVYAFRIGEPHERRVAVLFHDITEYKKADDALRDSEQRFRTMADNAPVMIWVSEPDGACSFLSKSWYDFTGQSEAASLGSGWFDAIHADDLAALHDSIRVHKTRREAFRVEYRLRCSNGDYLWVLDAAAPRFGFDGLYLGYIGSIIDISDRRRAEEKLRESEKRLLTIIEHLPAGVGVLNTNGSWMLSNSIMNRYVPEAMPSVVPERMVQWRAWDERNHPIVPENWPGKRALRGETVMPGMEMVYSGEEGGDLWMRVSAAPLRGDDSGIIGACVVVQDVSQVKHAEQALRDADRRKDEFLATLAHELRNPLAPIRNGLHILRLTSDQGGTSGRVHEMLEGQVNHMVRLVDDLMEVSRITGGKIELRKERIDLAAVLRSAVEISQPLIDAARHRLATSLPTQPLIVDADPVRLAQVIANLLNNAAKYTDEGGQIWLAAQRDGNGVIVSVRDNGMGIPETMLPKVFDLFTQVERTYHRAQGGLGIGLTLVRSLVELHGGSVEAKSEGNGSGSEFTVRLPIASSASTADHDLPVNHHDAGPLRRILVVDDNRDAGDTLGTILKLLGAEVHIARDGPAALAALKTYQPNVVLLDIGMPGMDGYELARRARQQPGSDELTLIAITGWGQEEDRRRSREAGIDHHLVKPVDIGALEQLLANLPAQREYRSLS